MHHEIDPVVYEELRAIAHRLMSRERSSHTLQPTALAHEAYARIAGHERVDPNDRGHFLSLAARAMRRVLVDHSRARASAKRGGDWERVDVEEIDGVIGEDAGAAEILSLHAALAELAELDGRQARIVELRFFAGLSMTEIGEVIGAAEPTVRRRWYLARAWLARRLGSQ